MSASTAGPDSSGAAYSAAAAAWADGPMRVYGPLAEELLARCPLDLRGRRLLDLGAGTGAASVAATALGARTVAVDSAFGMVAESRTARPPAAVGDALALPFGTGGFDVAAAAFSLNHLSDPAAGLREAGRVAREYVVASIPAFDDDHPVKQAVECALTEAGWTSPAWYRSAIAFRDRWGTVDAATAVVERAGLEPERIEQATIAFPSLGPTDLVRWRLGLAQCAGFVSAHDRRGIERRALEALGVPEPLVRSVVFIVARVR